MYISKFLHSTIFLQFFPQHHDPQMFVKETQTLPVLCWVQPWSSVPSVLLSLSLSRLSLSSDEAMSRVSIVTWSPLECQHCHCLPTGLLWTTSDKKYSLHTIQWNEVDNDLLTNIVYSLQFSVEQLWLKLKHDSISHYLQRNCFPWYYNELFILVKLLGKNFSSS